MKVSRICVGTMSYGSSKWSPWVLDETESIPMIKKAYDAGINFFDTADAYSNGESERILGKAIRELNIPRENLVIIESVFPSSGRHHSKHIPWKPTKKCLFNQRRRIVAKTYF
jgi:aryl-alcohol dehydrogenase-like predicted oxidoreductase